MKSIKQTEDKKKENSDELNIYYNFLLLNLNLHFNQINIFWRKMKIFKEKNETRSVYYKTTRRKVVRHTDKTKCK